MFFAPPKVKSLSRYAEFGSHLEPKYFLMMLLVAMLMHASVISIYAMMPREEVIRIPVRVMNIKLTGDNGTSVIEIPPPAPVVAPAAPVLNNAKTLTLEEVPVKPAPVKTEPVEEKPAPEKEKVLPKKAPTKPVIHAEVRPKPAHHVNDKARNLAAEPNLATPKRYVRASELSGSGSAAGQGGGRNLSASARNEIVERYEQMISLWVSNHRVYPEMAKRQGIEGDAVVRIRINRSGHILYNAIDHSSGNALIDAAVIAMVHASDPVPHVPEDYPEGSQLEFLIPVSFRLQ